MLPDPFTLAQGRSYLSFHFHPIHAHVSSSLSVLFLLTFYFLLYFTFLLFLFLSMTDNDSMNLNTLCNFANGTFVTLDDCLPDTSAISFPPTTKLYTCPGTPVRAVTFDTRKRQECNQRRERRGADPGDSGQTQGRLQGRLALSHLPWCSISLCQKRGCQTSRPCDTPLQLPLAATSPHTLA